MLNQLKIFAIALMLLSFRAQAAGGKFAASYGFFALSAKNGDRTSSISNPSAFHLGYLQPKWDKWELKIGYSVLMADFAGSDLGYGLDVGANYFPLTDSGEENFSDGTINARRYEIWKPFIGMSFNQRSFQSVRNSYAGFGFSAGIERYYNEKFNLRAEARLVSLGGSNESEATETSVFAGLVFKL